MEQAARHEPVAVGGVAVAHQVGDVAAVAGREYLVFGVAEALVEAQSQPFDRRPRKQLVPGPSETANPQQLGHDLHAGRMPLLRRDAPVGHGVLPYAFTAAVRRPFLDEVREDDAVLADAAVAELLQVVRGEGVVRIDEDHKLAACPVEPRVAGPADAPVRTVEDAHPRVARRMAVADLARAVGAPVVYEQQLEVAHRLAEDAFDARVEVFFDLVDRDYDGYQHGWQVRFRWFATVVQCRRRSVPAGGTGWSRRRFSGERSPMYWSMPRLQRVRCSRMLSR